MQEELPETIAIVGVNEDGRQGSNATFTEGRDLPWLQDTAEVNAWAQWGVSYRDVVLLDKAGQIYGVYNLSEHDLSRGGDYQDLEEALLALDARE